jgi:hypothetical protein
MLYDNSTCDMAGDSTREIRSMILLSLPCPPMPMLVSKEVMDEASYVHLESATCSSHDLIAHLLNKATVSSVSHHLRKESQQNANDILCARFDEWRAANPDLKVPPLEKSYEFFAEFTRYHIQSFMADPTKDIDVRFVPPHQVDTGSNMHSTSMDFALAQDILFGSLDGVRSVEAMSYPEFIQQSARRMLI